MIFYHYPDGIIHTNRISDAYSLYAVSMVVLILSNEIPPSDIKLGGVFKYVPDNDRYKYDIRIQAAKSTKNLHDALMLYSDTPLGSMAYDAFVANPDIFKRFFDYCLENKIITDIVYTYSKDFIEKINLSKVNSVNTNTAKNVSTYANILYPNLSLGRNVEQSNISSSYINTNNNQTYAFPGIPDLELADMNITEQTGYINTIDLENLPSVPRHNIYPRFYAETKQPEQGDSKVKHLNYDFGF